MRGVSQLALPIFILTLAGAALGEDVTVELGADDGFSVRDDSDAERFRVDSLGNTIEGRAHMKWLPSGLGGTAADNEVALAITTGVDTEGNGDLTVPIVRANEPEPRSQTRRQPSPPATATCVLSGLTATGLPGRMIRLGSICSIGSCHVKTLRSAVSARSRRHSHVERWERNSRTKCRTCRIAPCS